MINKQILKIMTKQNNTKRCKTNAYTFLFLYQVYYIIALDLQYRNSNNTDFHIIFCEKL